MQGDDDDFARQWARDVAREEAAIREQILRDTYRAAEEAAAEWVEEPDDDPVDIGPSRSDFVPQELEGRYVRRGANGLPALRFVRTGDRLSVESPEDRGAYVNPRGVGLRRIGLYSCHVRGSRFYADAYAAADLGPGRWLRLVREPENTHAPNATAICTPRGREPIGYVQRGRTAAIAKRLDAGEDLAGVSLRGPGRGSSDGATWLILGAVADLRYMLE